MSIKTTDMIIVGVMTGAHGVRGDVRVKSFTADPSALFEYAPFYSETGELLLDPKSVRPAKDHFVVTPKAPRQKEDWDAMRKTRLFVPRTMLPDTDDDEFYIDQLIGLTVYGGGDEAIGTIKAVYNHGAGDLLEITPKIGGRTGGKSVLVPFTLADVPVVDMAAKRVIVATFDIWADDSKPDDA